jgi:5-methylcytosine-specific restriction endonuclease McrA
MSSNELLAATRELVRRACGVEAELLVHLGEIDERKLYLDFAFPSMFAFCVGELGFSEDAAYNRITVARAGRRWPAVVDAHRSGQVHLAGLRLLAPHFTDENHGDVLALAAGKSKREIEERALRDKLRQAQDLLRHRIPDGDLATVIARAVDLLIEEVKKERFATGRKARQEPREDAGRSSSRHIPDSIKRAVFERDGGRCTFSDERGRRCAETGTLEFDHLNGFARTHLHDVDGIRLLCRAHNQHAADQIYGRAFMEQARASREPTRPGTSPQPRLV